VYAFPTVGRGREEGMAFTIHGLILCLWPFHRLTEKFKA